MDKTLQTIQKLSKLGRILSKIVKIICIVAAILCAIGLILLAVGADQVVKLGDVAIRALVENDGEQAIESLYAALVGAILLLAGEVVVAGFAARYFRHEYEAGTPFTREGAKEMKRLGILSLVIPIAAAILASIANQVISHGESAFSANPEVSVTAGVLFLVVSVIFKYGAEIRENRSIE